MSDTAPHLSLAPISIAPATVTGASERGVEARSPALGEVVARLALASAEYTPRAGDQVLLAMDGAGQAYVIGVLRALRPAAPPSIAGLEVERDGERTRLTLSRGDLELRAAAGRVLVSGAEGVAVSSEGDVAIEAGRRATIASVDAEGAARSGLCLDGSSAELRAGVLATRAAHLHTVAEDVTLIAARMDVHLERLRQRAAQLEIEAGELVERAKTSYREVEDLAQTRAGRLRLVARSTMHALAERVKMKAESIFAIDGESIHLG